MSKINTMISKSNLNRSSDELFIELSSQAAEYVQGGQEASSDEDFIFCPTGPIISPEKPVVPYNKFGWGIG